jgi:hypothetical protein
MYIHHFLEADPGPLVLILLSLFGGGVSISEDLISDILALLIFLLSENFVAKDATK